MKINSLRLISAVAAASTAVLMAPLSTASAQASADAPVIFQAAGPSIASIQSTVDEFRAALGADNNGSTPGPLPEGRREINWDGGGSVATSLAPTPFTGFLLSRGALFVTPGQGFVQAPTSGLAETFANPTYETIFQPFSPVRLFSAIGSSVTNSQFFVPGSGDQRATIRGFGAVFTDIDRPDASAGGVRGGSTLLQCFGVDGKLLYSGFVPSSPGQGGMSFLGVSFRDARIARVRIRSGNAIPGADDGGGQDVVMMDDFIYGEPQAVQQQHR
jgi:hypothetical protein